MTSHIYLDNASTTLVDPLVFQSMEPYFSKQYGNPSSKHFYGLQAKQALDKARNTIAEIFGCRSKEIIFTGSGTEANNLAILGGARANKSKGKHLITSKIEHDSVLKPFQQLEKEGFTVTYLSPDNEGLIDPAEIAKAITDQTILVSIIYANNEIGSIQSIAEIAEICRERKIMFHTDACQATGSLEINTQTLGINLMTFNASKIYGPKGIGLLYVKTGTKLEPIIYGGGQEFGLRSGTENLSYIVGFAKALELARENPKTENERLINLRDNFIANILEKIRTARLNGHPTKRLPNNINLTIPHVNGDELLLQLDEAGICCSSASACSAKTTEPSHVLLSLGHTREEAFSSIRISMGKYTTAEEMQYTAKKLVELIEKMQKSNS